MRSSVTLELLEVKPQVSMLENVMAAVNATEKEKSPLQIT